MNDIEILLSDAKEALYENEIVKEFFRLKKQIENSKELQELASNMRNHEKMMTQNMNNDVIYFREKALYEETKNKLESHPLMIDYSFISNEVRDLLLEVKEILS